VPFDANGFPIFDSIHDVNIGGITNRAEDVRAANIASGYTTTPDGYLWHHHQDGKTLQLVDIETHRATGHTGGYAMRNK